MGNASALKAVLLACAVALCASCSSTNVNHPSARAHMGYVDFYSPGGTNLCWSVKRLDPGTGKSKTVFSSVKPLPDAVLRLEVEPGRHLFQITFLNRVIEAPLTVDVVAQEGMVTPVKIELVPVGDVSVVTKEERYKATVRGGKTRYSSQPGTMERLTASVQAPQPYRPKEQMSYPP